MLMQGMPALSKLIFIKFATGLNMKNRLPRFFLEIRNPLWLMTMDRNIQLLQLAEVSTRRRADQEIRRLLLDLDPRLPPALPDIEIPTVGEVEPWPCLQSKLASYLGYPFGRIRLRYIHSQN